MNNIHWLKIEGQCGNETQIWINIPKGLTKEQADDFGKRLDEIVNEYGERHDEDYACFDYHVAIRKRVEGEKGTISRNLESTQQKHLEGSVDFVDDHDADSKPNDGQKTSLAREDFFAKYTKK